MSQPLDPVAQGELESLSEAIAGGLEPEHILALIAQRTCQVLGLAEAHIFLKHEQGLVRKASYQGLQETPPLPTLAPAESMESWVARRGRAIALEDALTDRRFQFPTVPLSIQVSDQAKLLVQAAAVPIWSGHQVVGVLSVIDFDNPTLPASSSSVFKAGPSSVSSAGSRASIKGLLPLLSVLADLISLALENTRILAREERRSKLITLLHYMASNLPGKLLKEVAEAMEAHIGEVMGVQKVEVLLYHEETDELVSLTPRETALGRVQQELGLDHLPLGKAGVLADVFRTGQPFLSNDLERVPQFPAALREKLGVKAALVVPLEVEEQRRGLLCVMSSAAEVFFEEDLPFLRLISTRLGHLLHNQELSRELAEAEAQRLARAEQEDFLLEIAHDLKNVLTMMRGNAQLALRRISRGDLRSQEQALKLIAAKSSQAIQLVNDMADVNQIETGLFRLFMETVDVVEVLQEEVTTLQETTGEQYIITFQSAFDQVLVEADRHRLSQVLTNLLTNAIRYSPQGGTIEVLLSQVSSEANLPPPTSEANEPGQVPQTVMVTINDEGVGIPPEERERIFERSFRGRGARFAPGSGLGLYISREIIERHGGRLWVEPREKQGSSFRFTLPISRAHLNGAA